MELVKSALRSSPKGLTVTDVAASLHMSRNSASKYLEMLRVAGLVEMRTFGRSRIFYLSRRLPLVNLISLSSDLIVLVDDDLKISEVNDKFLRYAGVARGEVVGHSIETTTVPLLVHRDVLLNIRDVLRGREFVREISLRNGPEEHFFHCKLIPVASQDGRQKAAVVYEDVTRRRRAEIALRESEAQYRLMVENSKDVLWKIDARGRWTFISGNVEQVIGYRADEVVGRTIWDFLAPEYHGVVNDNLRRRLRGEDIPPYEVAVLTRDGRQVPFELLTTPIVGDDGKVAGVQGVSRMITERKRAEEALRESEEKFRVLSEASQAGIVLLQGEDIVYLNKALAAMGGYTVEECRGMDYWEFIHPDFRELIRQRTSQSQETSKVEQRRYEIKIRRKDGRDRWVDISPGLLTYKGKPALLVTVVDITEHKRAAEALRESEARYRAVVEDMVELVCRTQPDTTITFVNGSWCRLFGLRREDVLGKKLLDLVPAENRDEVRGLFAAALAGRYPVIAEYEIPMPDGSERKFEWTTKGILDDQGLLVELQMVARDVTNKTDGPRDQGPPGW